VPERVLRRELRAKGALAASARGVEEAAAGEGLGERGGG
jgi:hypothetical protein